MEDLLDSLYGAAADPRAWPGCCTDLAQSLGASSSMLFIENRNAHTVTPLAMPDYSDAQRLLYAQHYYRIDPFLQATRRHTHLDAALGTSLVDPDMFKHSEIWTDFIAKSARSFHFLCGLGELRQGLIFGVAVHRTPRMSGFDGHDCAILQKVMPHLRRALQLGERLERDRLKAAAQSAALSLEHSDLGIIVCDGQARVSMVNGAGEAFCRAHGFKLGGRGAVFEFGGVGANAELSRLIGATARGGAGGRICFEGAAVTSVVSICRMPGALASAYAPPVPHGDHLVLVMVRPRRRPLPEPGELRRRFGLTKAEAAVALSVCSGKTCADTALQRGVSVTTVRTQVRAILEKAGAGSLRDLAGRIATLPH